MASDDPLGWLPGVALLAALGVLAVVLAGVVPLVDALVFAVAVGAVAGNVAEVPEWIGRGVEQYKLLLEVGIVLLGASIPLAAVVDAGATVLALVVGTVAVGLLLVEAVSRTGTSLAHRSGSLLAAGASICGVSAAVAVAGSIDADEELLGYVAGGILFFDAVTLVAFPLVGGGLGLSDRVFGVWAGLSMFSTGPVAAAGFSYSPSAGEWATLTKLVRNALIGVVAVGYAVVYAGADESARDAGRLRTLWGEFPKFLIGFVVVVAVANAGLLSVASLAALETASTWLFVVAFVGVGFEMRVADVRRAGPAPLVVLLVYLVVVGSLTLAAASVLL